MAGPGRQYLDALERLLADHPHRDRIRLLGHVRGEAFWEAMDVAVHCTQDEPFGYVILEALAKGKIVIGANGGGVPEMIADGVNGMLQDPTDCQGLADKINAAVTGFPELGPMPRPPGKRWRSASAPASFWITLKGSTSKCWRLDGPARPDDDQQQPALPGVRRLRSRRLLGVRLRTGERLFLRPPPATDLSVANEVFIQKVYDVPAELDASSVRFVVDLGANVGYTCLQWLRLFPNARVTAFEPHPAHVELAQCHFDSNGFADRVELISAAAGVSSGRCWLSDAGSQSKVKGDAASGSIAVRVIDFFEKVKGRTIDLLKIDVEGSEYPLLADERFAGLDVRRLILEWHRTDEHPDGENWCRERLRQLGYQTREGDRRENFGLLWARRMDRRPPIVLRLRRRCRDRSVDHERFTSHRSRCASFARRFPEPACVVRANLCAAVDSQRGQEPGCLGRVALARMAVHPGLHVAAGSPRRLGGACHPVSLSALVGHTDSEETRLEMDGFIRRCTPGMVLVDVGDHYGMFTLTALHYGGASARVVAVDPSPVCTRTSSKPTCGWQMPKNG